MLQDIDKVGDKHTLVKVKDGYGRNFLIPKGYAIIANKTNRARLDEMLRHEAAKESKLLDTYKELAKKLEALYPNIKIVLQDETYSSINAKHIIQNYGYKKHQQKDRKLVDKIAAALIIEEYMKSSGKWDWI